MKNTIFIVKNKYKMHFSEINTPIQIGKNPTQASLP